jgi:hypothetical protein
MSKFTALCEKVEKLLREEEGALPTDPNAAAPAPAPAPVEGAGDPAAGDQQPPIAPDKGDIHILSNDQIKDLVLNLKDYLVQNLGKENGLSQALIDLGSVSNDDGDIKKIYDEIASVVIPKKAETNTKEFPKETKTVTA